MTPAVRTPRAGVARSAWIAYLGVGALLCLLYVTVSPFRGSGPVMNFIGLTPVIAILAGVRMHKPASPGPWRWFAIGFALFWFGDLYTYSYPLLLNGDVPFPSPGDGAYLLVYPALITGLVLLVRRRRSRKDRSRLIDGLILTVGLSLPSWVALIAPYVHDDTLSIVAKSVSVAYPLADVLLLAAAIPLALDAGRREPAFYLVSSSILLLLVTDFVYGVLILHGVYTHQLWLDLGWLGFYLLWGAAALHPVHGPDGAARGREGDRAHALPPRAAQLRVAARPRVRAPARPAPGRLRHRGRHRRLRRPLHPRGAPHGGPRAPAGALAGARADAELGRRRARRGHGPGRDPGRRRRLRPRPRGPGTASRASLTGGARTSSRTTRRAPSCASTRPRAGPSA